MKYVRAALLVSGLLWGTAGMAQAGTTYFDVTDEPGRWFDSGTNIAGTRSLAIVAPNEKITFLMKSSKFGPHGPGPSRVESLHTVTSLIWPSTASKEDPNQLLDEDKANQDDHTVILRTPGLHVFVCKLHPYMLAAVIVDKDHTADNLVGPDGALDIGERLTLLVSREVTNPNLTFDSYSDLGLRALRAFFIVTNPDNWKDYTKADLPSPQNIYQPTYPHVPVRVTGGTVAFLDEVIITVGKFDGKAIAKQVKPQTKGVGEVWVDTQFELSAGKGPGFPGTMSVVEVDSLFPAKNWEVKRKIALPHEKMNNGHNMWPSHDQQQIYQTEWHGTSLFRLDRVTGKLLQEVKNIGSDPAHVMTRVDTQQVHVGLNGEDGVMELNRSPGSGWLFPSRIISMQDPNNKTKQTQPHAHWMGFDGGHMVTPNSNSADSTLYEFTGFNTGHVLAKHDTGGVSIAASMMPDSSKYYVTNYLGHSISVMNGPKRKLWYGKIYQPGEKIKDISLLEGYDPVAGCQKCVDGLIGGFPVQTPVSPDGKFVVTGNTLGGTISIVSTATDTLVKILPCDPGCHGVNFGAKRGGGYYAYVTPKFSNRLIVLDYDPDNNGTLESALKAEIVGWVILANDKAPNDDAILGNRGMGAQGVLPVPVIYNGWVQELPPIWKIQLTKDQRNPIGRLDR